MSKSYIVHSDYCYWRDVGDAGKYYLVMVNRKTYVAYINKPFDIGTAQVLSHSKVTIESFIESGIWKRFNNLKEVKAYALQKELDRSLR